MFEDFLVEREPISWSPPAGFPPSFAPADLFTQNTPHGLEIVLVETARRPPAGELRKAWHKRRSSRVSPVLIVAAYPIADGIRVSLCGPVGEHPPIQHDVEISQAERLADVALNEPSHHAATRFLIANLPEMNSELPGVRNMGLFATQELRVGVPQRSDWQTTKTRGSSLLAFQGRELVEKLGFEIENLTTNTWKLTTSDRHTAVAVFCDDDEPFEAPSQRFNATSPVSQALAVADRHDVDWMILTRASEIRLYAARADTGVGRKGRAETFIELNLALLPEESAGYLPLLFAAEALQPQGSVDEILGESERFAAALAQRLRERVYFETVPALAAAIAGNMGSLPTSADLKDAYEQVMMILFRLLFVAYAEDKDLLPYRTNSRYQDHSLQKLAIRLVEDHHADRQRYDTVATSMWADVCQLWEAVNRGNISWGVPAYNGGLFSDDPKINPTGSRLTGLQLTDHEFAPALTALLIDETPEGVGPVDFRSLSVREFGTIYEGLLESRLTVAQEDLAIRSTRGTTQYLPAEKGEPVEVAAGGVYLQHHSGKRKSTGSYFTKPFAVEHLLDHALKPALDDHIAHLNALHATGDEAALADAFFDFRCADIAMGSGHFLVAAVDHIEARLSAWLTEHPLAAVTNELERLRHSALDALGELSKGVEIESGSLLRRQVARRCVYGVDKNPIAAELARLAIWVHTFVPGLPLSFLDHNLVCGDSLTGVRTLDQVVAVFDPDASPDNPSLFRDQLEKMLAEARQALRNLARTSDATKAEIDQAREAHEEASKSIGGARALFDVITAHQAEVCALPENFDEATFIATSKKPEVARAVKDFKPQHFPAAFPEVFLRERPGFDCVIGNPPWDKVVADRKVWWGLHLPGVRSLPVAQRRARIDDLEKKRPDLAEEFANDKQQADTFKRLLRITFPKLGSGQTDLSKAFAWANLELTREGGKLGLVLPRTAVSDAGMTNWRKQVTKDLHPPPSADGFKCQWQRLSTTRAGCSTEFTTLTLWPSQQSTNTSPAPFGGHLPQHQAVGFRWSGRPLHHRAHHSLQTPQPAHRAMGVSLREPQTSLT
ncbi:MAG: hypothetical protein OXI96_00480 [Acidimicrobiaceae bacterium]|nr:hypothetical protein [Acidimicrobiaceae bacterium]